MLLRWLFVLCLSCASSVSWAELQALSDDSLGHVAGQAGITLETSFEGTIDAYVAQYGTTPADAGGAIKLEGIKLVDFADNSKPAAVITTIDVVEDVVASNVASLKITSSFTEQASLEIGAIRLGSTAKPTSATAFNNNDESFSNAYANINGCSPCGLLGSFSLTPSASLGSLTLTGLTGTASVIVKAH